MRKFLLIFIHTTFLFLVGKAQNRDTGFFQPRMRVIVDNDFSGDPDGLFQLAQQVLSNSAEIRAVIGSHLHPKDWFDNTGTQADNAARKAKELLTLLNADKSIPVLAGSNTGMPDARTAVADKAVDFIIQEARRTDTKAPLYIVCGAGLTEVASAVIKAPDIADKFTLVWIGGPEYSDLAFPPPNGSRVEYNLNIDTAAARCIFNYTTVKLWQVPRNAYRQCLVSLAELADKVKPCGRVGAYLYESLASLLSKARNSRWNLGETYVLGDSPLVLLTALQSGFEADPASSAYVIKKLPLINAQGGYDDNPNGRPVRVYTHLDTRLMFDDLFSKLRLLK
ncbi:MAG: nucleoside hydrolase [Chitinophagaceae bacterium]